MGRVSLYGQREPDRRRAPNGSKAYDIKKLWDRNHEICNLVVIGMNQEDVAKTLGVSPVTVSNTVNSSLGQEKIALMRGARDADTWDAAKKIQEVAKKSLTFLELALDDKVRDLEGQPLQVAVSTKVNIAKHVLNDLSGLKAPTRIEGKFAHAHLTTEDIEELKARGRKAAAEIDVIEVRPE